MKDDIIRVGIGVFVIKDGEFLLMQRDASHGEGTWSLPGGHLDFGESFEDTAHREVKEETGLDIQNVRFGAVLNNYFEEEHKQYVTIWMVSEWAGGEEYIAEPNKCTALAWHTFDNLPAPLFLPWKQFLESEFFTTIKQQLK